MAGARRGGVLEAFELITATPGGWPHASWLGAGEILPVDATTCRWCLHTTSTTVANLQASGRGLLQAVLDGRVVKVQFEARYLGDMEVRGMAFAAFEGTAVNVSQDSAPYATVRSGLRYELIDAVSVADRWGAQLDALALADQRTDPLPSSGSTSGRGDHG